MFNNSTKFSEKELDIIGQGYQMSFDKKVEEIREKLHLDAIDKYMGEMAHITIAEWCIHDFTNKDIKNVNNIYDGFEEYDRQIIYNMIQHYWRIKNVKGTIDFHKDNNTIILQILCYEESVKSFGFSVYNNCTGKSHTEEIDWYKVISDMKKEEKERIWNYITNYIEL